MQKCVLVNIVFGFTRVFHLMRVCASSVHWTVLFRSDLRVQIDAKAFDHSIGTQHLTEWPLPDFPFFWTSVCRIETLHCIFNDTNDQVQVAEVTWQALSLRASTHLPWPSDCRSYFRPDNTPLFSWRWREIDSNTNSTLLFSTNSRKFKRKQQIKRSHPKYIAILHRSKNIHNKS